MRDLINAKILLMLVLVSIVSVMFITCGDDSDQVVEEEAEDVIITIGNLTDKTGVGSVAITILDTALRDMVEYYNEENLIPGVRIETIEYDGQFNPDKDIPGYEYLRSEGADLIWAPVPHSSPNLLPRANIDKYPVFVATANMDPSVLEGGYVFSLGITPEYECYTMLEWIANNHEDFPQDRPAKIGGAAWKEAYSNIWFEAAERYATENPDKYEWVDGILTEFKFTWDAEIPRLGECDYAYMPSPPQLFVKDFGKEGYETTLIGSEVHAVFLGMLEKSDSWGGIDGALFIRVVPWWDERGEMVDLINRLLDEKHSPSEAQQIRDDGIAYLSAKQVYLMLDIVRQTVEDVGPENFNQEALYRNATSWQYELMGVEDFNSFTESKRMSQNYYAIYEGVAATKSLKRVSDWMHQVTEP